MTPERVAGDPPGAGAEYLELGLYELRAMRLYGEAPAELLAPIRLVMHIYRPPASHEHFDIARVREGTSEVARETLFSRLGEGFGCCCWTLCPSSTTGEIADLTFDYEPVARSLVLRLPSADSTYTEELVLQRVDATP